jgi:hypothetical protein
MSGNRHLAVATRKSRRAFYVALRVLWRKNVYCTTLGLSQYTGVPHMHSAATKVPGQETQCDKTDKARGPVI